MRRVSTWLSLLGLWVVCAIVPHQTLDAQDAAAQQGTNQVDDESPLLEQPKTPAEMFAATVKLVDFARPDLARRYLERFMASDPDDQTILALRDEFGPETFLRLSRLFSDHPFNGVDFDGWKFRKTPEGLPFRSDEDVITGQDRWKIGSAAPDASDPEVFDVSNVVGVDEQPMLINIHKFDDPLSQRPIGFDLLTAEQYGSSVFRCEFMLARGGALGVYMMGRYKVLVRDRDAKRRFGQNDVGAIHQAAIVESVTQRAPGTWNTLEIHIRAPRFANGEKTKNARFAKIVVNDQVIREDWEIQSASLFGVSEEEAEAGPLLIQGDHGPVALRGIQISSPLAVELLDRMNEAFKRASSSPDRLDALIAQLSGTPEQRELAIIQLRSHAQIALPRMLKVLGAPKSEKEKDVVLYTLTRLGDQIHEPLLASLATPDENLLAIVVEALGHVGSRHSVPYLWYPAFSPDQPTGVRAAAVMAIARLLQLRSGEIEQVSSFGASRELARMADRHFRKQYKWTEDTDGNVQFWFWNDKTGTVESRQLPSELASLLTATEFARQALALAPERADRQALYLATALASVGSQHGPDEPFPTGPGTIHDLALTTGGETVTAALKLSLESRNAFGALATLRILGQIGTRHQLFLQSSQRAPVVSALNYPDPRVQFAAATTILQMDPEAPFRGSRRVVSILTRSLGDTGTPTALVVDASLQRGTSVAAAVKEQGFDPLTARTGREGFELAAERNDIELILLQFNTIRWGLTQTIANLQADARTANIPIAIYGPLEMRSRLRSVLDQYPAVAFVVTSVDSAALTQQLAPFLAENKPATLSLEQRARQKAQAAFWFRHIAGGQRTRVYDIRPAEKALTAAVIDKDLAADAITALGSIPTATSQQSLTDLITAGSLEDEFQEYAAIQLAFHIQRFGLQLSREQMVSLRSTWESTQSAKLKTALASVIGSLQPDARLINQRLEQLPRVTPTTIAP